MYGCEVMEGGPCIGGSIIEAVLLDYLVAEKHVDKEKSLTMGLGAAVRLAERKGVISKKSSDLSSAINEYRNLVHPEKQSGQEKWWTRIAPA